MSSASVQDISGLEITSSWAGHLNTPIINPTSDVISVTKNAASDTASAAISVANTWSRDDVLGSLPWLQWRGVALTPVCEDLCQPHDSVPSDGSNLRYPEQRDRTTILCANYVEKEMEMEIKKAMCSKLSCGQTEHTTQYRDEELEREIDIALSRRIGRPGLKAASKGSASALRDAPCVLRRKVIPRSGPNRTQVITDRLAPRGGRLRMGKGEVHSSLQEGLAQMIDANREALLEKRTYSMVNRKPSLRNQMLARKDRHLPQESDSGEINVSKRRRNYSGEDTVVNGEARSGNDKSTADPRLLLQPLRKSLFQVPGPGVEFNPNDFVTSSTTVITGTSKKSDLRTALGPGRIRGDWISALIAGGPPPGVRKRVDLGAKPASISVPCTVTATSSSFKKKFSRDHNEDDFTAIEDGNELNLSTACPLNDPLTTLTTHSKSILERKPPLAFNVNRFQEKGRLKFSNGNIPLIRSSQGFGKLIRQKDGDKSGEKIRDFIPAPAVKKKRALDDVRTQLPASEFQTSLSGSDPGTETVIGSGTGIPSNDFPLNPFIPWRSGNQDNNVTAKRVRQNPEVFNLPISSAARGTLSGPYPPVSSSSAITVGKAATRFPPTFKANQRLTPPSSKTSMPPFSMNQEMNDHEQLGWANNNDRMDLEEPYMEGASVPGYPLIQGDDLHPVMPVIDQGELVDDSSHSCESSSKPLSPSHTQSGRDGKCLIRRDGIPTARSMNSNSVGGVIVSGTLQRAKPGPKPRLQFTSDGDSNTVRKIFIFYMI